ncbi:exodeoxyribonuclease V subunit beta [Thalassotalea aquiviva]|uniref:exodeoxyribonuclease V subunit beta n=1 Tax=Thalassotalea aquiviva TaxID=3242415 RepID=UPI00352B98F8
MASTHFEPQLLRAEQLPLTGCHLIEASAGTGKTYNITRIYLRMLLEQKVAVENILVMTFTKAATEEIRGRIDEFLRQALNNWDTLVADKSDPFFYQLGQSIEQKQAKILLKHALLSLDDAAIFTIHSFCKRVLSQQAFASKMTFNANMEADDSTLVLEAVQDHYRLLAKADDIKAYQTFVAKWDTPSKFLSTFRGLIATNTLIEYTTQDGLNQQIQASAKESVDMLDQHEALIFNELINNKSGKIKQNRIDEFSIHRQYFQQLAHATLNQIEHLLTQQPDFKFFSANRLPKSKDKAEIKNALKCAFSVCEKLKNQIKNYHLEIEQAQVYGLVLEAVDAIKQRIAVSKSMQNLLNFDDLILQLAKAIENEHNQDQQPLTNALRRQYPIALVDEFQDTDAEQFAILDKVYFAKNLPSAPSNIRPSAQPLAPTNNELALYLIGDPKQAIYGFRGGDIFTYLKAAAQVDCQWVMDTNWRSAKAMISGYNHLFYGGDLNTKSKDVFKYNIQYLPVKPAPIAPAVGIKDPKDKKALQFVNFIDDERYAGSKNEMKIEFRHEIANWCANEVARLLSQASLTTKDDDTSQPIQAHDIAILVRDGSEAEEIKQALARQNIACVYKSQRANLFASAAAIDFIAVLHAIINTDDERAFIVALAGPYFGKTASELYQLQQNEAYWEHLRSDFNQLKGIWFKRGFMAMALHLLHQHYPGAKDNTERQLTNIIHLFELLQTASQRYKQPQELLAYLQQQCENPAGSEAELRLESDANLVQIVTLHGSKGLEYPVVFVPFASRHKSPVKFNRRIKDVLSYHDKDGQHKLHIGMQKVALQAMADEGYAEDIRLLYVAITRAKYRCYLGCANFSEAHLSSLGQCLGMSNGQDFQTIVSQFQALDPSSIGLEQVISGDYHASRLDSQDEPDVLSVAKFNGKIERDWWLSSFTALTRNIRHGGKMEPDRDLGEDSEVILAKHQIRYAIAKGARTGNFLHDLLEWVDFTAPNWTVTASRALDKYGDLPSGFARQDVYDWLDQILDCHLNTQGLNLRQLPVASTLREAEFYFPMENVDIRALEAVVLTFRRQLTTAEDVSQHIRLPSVGQLKGMMHGFIDLIFEHNNKYYVCDYKSSHLGDARQCYQPARLEQHVCSHFYDLQFLIYSLALHRYLGRRVENYQFEQHFGGVYYLYLRGMHRPSEEALKEPDSTLNPELSGVFYHSLSADLMTQLDACFKGAAVDANAALSVVKDPKAQTQKSSGSGAQQGELF